MTRLTDFYEMLCGHDWYYTFSDDGRVYRRGNESESNLRVIAAESPAHQAVFDSFKNYYFSGPSWGNDQAPAPTEPKEEPTA